MSWSVCRSRVGLPALTLRVLSFPPPRCLIPCPLGDVVHLGGFALTVRSIDDVYAARLARWAFLASYAESRRGRVRYPMTSLISCASRRSWSSRGRPRLWYRPGDLVSVGGVDGIYIRRVDGSKGRAHVIRTELSIPPSSNVRASLGYDPSWDCPLMSPRRSSELVVWGPVELLLPDPSQLTLF